MCLGLPRLVISCNDIPEFFDPPSPREIYAVFANNRCAEEQKKTMQEHFRRFITHLKKKAELYFTTDM